MISILAESNGYVLAIVDLLKQRSLNVSFFVKYRDDIFLKDISVLEGTQVRFRTRSAEDEATLSTALWSDYTSTSGNAIASSSGRFVEIQAELGTSDKNTSPVLEGISFYHSNDPDT